MIQSSLNYLCGRLNTALKQSFDIEDGDVVELARFSGAEPGESREKVMLQLIRLEKITTPHQPQNGFGSPGRQAPSTSPVYINLYVLVAANFSVSNYPQALAYISQVLEFFQDNGVFERQNSPDMPAKIDKLCLEIENVGPHDLGTIWGMVGAKYMPSVIYKVSLLSIGGVVKGQVTSLSKPTAPVGGQH
ncbi:MAG: hypothetical protein ACI8WB_001235 [Phenylobacterium sp.]|jgi:hypothetical protein